MSLSPQSPNPLAQEAQALIAWCDPAGRLLQILRDNLGLAGSGAATLAECLDPESADKCLGFLMAAQQQGAALDWELNAAIPAGADGLLMSGFWVEGRVLVAGRRRTDDERYRDEWTRLANELANAQRQLKKQNITLEAQVQARTRLLEAANQDLQAQVAERQRAEAQLEQSNHELRQLSARLEQSREDERRQLSRELHDVLGGELTTLMMEMASLRRALSPSGEAALHSLSRVERGILSILQTVRSMATNLRPSLLDDFGLIAALEWQTNEFEARANTRCRFVTELETVDLDGEKPIALFRILQEGLTNIARHAQATEVEVRLSQAAGCVVLEIQDNGRGFTTGKLGHTRSLGLIGMRERARLAGGELDITSAPGQGTTLIVRVPLAAPE